MRNNVISFNKEVVTPNDLLSVREFALKHNMKISYLYKLFERGKIKRYKRGVWKISECETLEFLNGDC